MIARVKFAVLMFLAVLALWGVGKAHAVDNPDRSRDGAAQYCEVWSGQALYGAAKYLQAPVGARQLALTVVYQTSLEDKAEPIAPKTQQINGGEHAVVIVVTDGIYANGDVWAISEDNKRWLEAAFMSGWDWVQIFLKSNAEAQVILAPKEWWLMQLRHACMQAQES